MKLIAIEAGKRQNGEVVFSALQEASEKERIALDDIALVYRDGGRVHVHHRKGGVARLFRHGIEDRQVEQIVARRDVESFVFASGSEDQVEAVARRVRTLGDGDFRTYDVDGSELLETTQRDPTYAVEDTEAALLEEPEIPEPLGSENLIERANRG